MTKAEPSTKKILIIDDDESQVSILEHIFKREGFQVFKALNGKDAKAKLKSVEPDLVTMDLMLPGSSGLELIQHMQSEGMGSVPVIVITGRYNEGPSNDEQMVRMEPNVKDFIRKPVHPTKLIMRVHEILETAWPMGGKAPN